MLKPHILLIDQHPQERGQYRSILEADNDLGIATLTSTDTAEEALELAAKALDEGQGYALAILDLNVSNDIDAVAAARELRQLDAAIMLVFICSHSDYNGADIDRRLGHDLVFLNKPVAPDELKLLIRNALEQWQQNQNQSHLYNHMANSAKQDSDSNQRARKMLAQLSQALTTVEHNMASIRQEDEKIHLLHHQLQQTLAAHHPSSGAVDDVQIALHLALQKYRQYCASPKLLTAVMQLRKLQKDLPL